MLAFLFYVQKQKSKQQCSWETSKEKWTREDNKKVIEFYFKNNPKQRDYKKRMMEIWTESTTFNPSQRLVDRARLNLKKNCQSDLDILEIYGQVNREEHTQ